MDTNLMPKSCRKFYCKICDFICSKESNWNIHINTAKHKNGYIGVTNDTNLMPKNAKIFECKKCRFICSKKSNYDAHLLTSKHKMEINGNIMEI